MELVSHPPIMHIIFKTFPYLPAHATARADLGPFSMDDGFSLSHEPKNKIARGNDHVTRIAVEIDDGIRPPRL